MSHSDDVQSAAFSASNTGYNTLFQLNFTTNAKPKRVLSLGTCSAVCRKANMTVTWVPPSGVDYAPRAPYLAAFMGVSTRYQGEDSLI